MKKKVSLKGKTGLITPFERYKKGSKKQVVGMMAGFKVIKKGKKKIADTTTMKRFIKDVLKKAGEENVEAIFLYGGAADYIKKIDTRADQQEKTYGDLDYIVITKDAKGTTKLSPSSRKVDATELESRIGGRFGIKTKRGRGEFAVMTKDIIDAEHSFYELIQFNIVDSIPIYEKKKGTGFKIIGKMEEVLRKRHKDFERMLETKRRLVKQYRR